MKKVLVFFFSLLVCKLGHTQNFATPNAAAIGISAQYPQASFTGVPAINIPLYNLTYGGVSIPINLSYNTNGVKPNVYGSWVGLGWNLSSGGAINRVVNGDPDDLDWNAFDAYQYLGQGVTSGFYYNYGYLNSSNWATSYNIMHAIFDMDDYSFPHYQIPTIRTVKDYAPDEFSFSVADISGYFYMDHLGQWKVRSNNKIKVQISSGDFDTHPTMSGFPSRKYLKKITLIDHRGIKYIFGGVANSMENAINITAASYVKTWYLSSIVSPEGKTIQFNYDEGENVEENHVTGKDLVYGSFMVATQIMAPVYLTSIETELHKINFYRSEAAGNFAKLDSIRIYGNLDYYDPDNHKQTFVFAYGNNPMDRLRLDSVWQKTSLNKVFQKYRMNYNSTQLNHSTNVLTTYVNTDHWGFNSTIGLNASNITTFYDSKEADTANCRAELLTRIVYPTGGYTQYTWEPNSYSKRVDYDRTVLSTYTTNINAGGVRIKQISNYDQDNSLLGKKRYSYIRSYSPSNTEQLSSGILNGPPRIEYSSSLYYSFASYLPLLSNNTGSHISYSEVTEINADNSYTTTVFSNFDKGSSNEYMDEAAVYNTNISNSSTNREPQYISNSHERGVPLSEKMYTSSAVLIKEKSTAYERIDKANEYVRSYWGKITGFYLNEPGTWSYRYVEGSAIKIYTNSYLPSVITETIYDESGSNPVTASSTLTYNTTYRQLEKNTTVNSLGETKVTELKYPYNFTGQAVYDSMVVRNMISPVIEQVDNRLDGSTLVPLNTQQTNYALWNSPANLALPATVKNKKGSGSLEMLNEYHRYDNSGNVLSVSQRGGPQTSYLYAYKGHYPVAEIRNADYSTVESTLGTSPISTFRTNKNPSTQSIRNFLASVQTALPNSMISAYTYKPLVGMTAKTDARSQASYYEYDNYLRLSVVRDHFGNILKQYCYNFAGQQQECFSIGTGTPTITGPAIYARLELKNASRLNPSPAFDYYYADLYVSLYSDEACTVPFVNKNNIQIQFRQSITAADNYNPSGSTTEQDFWFEAMTGSNSILVASNMETQGYEEFGTDPYLGTLYYSSTTSYTLLASPSVNTQPYTVYTAKPTEIYY